MPSICPNQFTFALRPCLDGFKLRHNIIPTHANEIKGDQCDEVQEEPSLPESRKNVAFKTRHMTEVRIKYKLPVVRHKARAGVSRIGKL